jgi:hypothetical protein
MRTSLDLLAAVAEIDSYLDESMCLIFQAEERLLQLERDGACWGHLLMGAQILKAMRRNLRLIQERRNSLEKEIAALPVAPPVQAKRRWWSYWSYRGRQPRDLPGGRAL